jgi:hypothetical protein
MNGRRRIQSRSTSVRRHDQSTSIDGQRWNTIGSFLCGPKVHTGYTGGHTRCPRQRIGSLNMVNECVGTNGSVRLHRPTEARALGWNRTHEHTRTGWVGCVEMPLPQSIRVGPWSKPDSPGLHVQTQKDKHQIPTSRSNIFR